MKQAQPPQQPGNVIRIEPQRVARAAAATLNFIGLETTLIPGNMRQQLNVLEVVLAGLAQGNLVVASPDQLAVESGPDKEPNKEPDNGGSDDNKAPQTALEKGREPTGPELPKTDAGMEQENSAAGSDAGTSGAERTGSGGAGEA